MKRGPAERPRGREGQTKTKPRDPLWENVRYVSATCVLIGHFITPLRDQYAGMHWLYNATWHLGVPAFALISGRFSSALPLTARSAQRLIQGILLPYLAVSLLTSLQIWLLGGSWNFFVVEPVATLWFLLSLIFWKIALPYAVTLRHPLTVSVLAALAVGFAEDVGFAFSASQTVTFFPFFYIGYLIGQGGWQRRAVEAVPRWAAACVTVALFGGAWLADDRLEPVWLAMKRPYSQDSYDLMWGVPVRAAVLVWGVLATVALIRLVPRRRVPFMTTLGTAGLYIYVLHPLVLRQLYHVDFFRHLNTSTEAVEWLLVAIITAALLGSPPVQMIARPFVQPRARWLFRATEQDRPREAPASDQVFPPKAGKATAPERQPI
ncbi:acyltransferase family protein [Streptomyces hoynatensis]|uniref:acyltransferase family protein n=1 Tax=Streptomyces hoynatensis TaxID=1141874 RepID=UPI001319D242|nr:acyltransferase family protein [Streptomyces hoynatensis]